MKGNPSGDLIWTQIFLMFSVSIKYFLIQVTASHWLLSWALVSFFFPSGDHQHLHPISRDQLLCLQRDALSQTQDPCWLVSQSHPHRHCLDLCCFYPGFIEIFHLNILYYLLYFDLKVHASKYIDFSFLYFRLSFRVPMISPQITRVWSQSGVTATWFSDTSTSQHSSGCFWKVNNSQ